MSPLKPAETAPTAFLGLGSNQGDRASVLAEALDRLGRLPGVRVMAVSSLYATAPVGREDQPEFLNAAVEIRTTLPPRELLTACLRIEAELGRIRTERWGPRTIDIDVLLYGDRMQERAFVLAPLAEIAPGLLLDGTTVAVRAEAIDRFGVRRLERKKFGWPPAPTS